MKKILFLNFFALLILGIGLAIYAFFIEPKKITVNQYELGANIGQKPVKLLQLSDIHLRKGYSTDQLKKIVQAANNEKPDIIVFTGDLFDNFSKHGLVDETIAVLSELKAPLGKFAVWGNHDYGGGASVVYPEIWAGSGFQLLKNTSEMITTENGQFIHIVGIDDSLFGRPSISDALLNKQKSDYTLLLSHEPDVTEQAADYDISLVLSGHSHGGQVNIPFFPVTPPLGQKYVKGFYTLSDTTTLYVNSGLGTSTIPVRLGVPPEITVFQLYI